jgi:hypothetical protein
MLGTFIYLFIFNNRIHSHSYMPGTSIYFYDNSINSHIHNILLACLDELDFENMSLDLIQIFRFQMTLKLRYFTNRS